MLYKNIGKNLFRVVASHIVRNLSLSQVMCKESNEEASKKLHDLLQSIIKDDSLEKDSKPIPNLSSLGQVIPKKKPQRSKPKELGNEIIKAAEEVGKTLPGKPNENEAQLLHRVLYSSDNKLSENIKKTAYGNSTLKDLISGMNIEKSDMSKSSKGFIPGSKYAEYSRAQKVRGIIGQKKFLPGSLTSVHLEKINLFDQDKLGLFNSDNFESEEKVKLDTWTSVRNRDLKLLITHPPNNIYEQMIIWTERGILWKFPIDNEYGLEEEKNTDFTEHIFLENQIEDWCPEHGPIRHFMELVCVGLSRNYWLSAKEKKDHLLWYKEFFSSKKELINELGAGEIRTEQAPPQIQ